MNTTSNPWQSPDAIARDRIRNAAPDLLAALEALLEETDDPARCASTGNGHLLSRGTRRQVADAIAKARGVEDQ